MEIGKSNLAFGTTVTKHNLDVLSQRAKDQVKIASKAFKKSSAPGLININGIGRDHVQLSYNPQNAPIRYGFVEGDVSFNKIIDAFKKLVKGENK
jgi:hypothetical protein